MQVSGICLIQYRAAYIGTSTGACKYFQLIHLIWSLDWCWKRTYITFYIICITIYPNGPFVICRIGLNAKLTTIMSITSQIKPYWSNWLFMMEFDKQAIIFSYKGDARFAAFTASSSKVIVSRSWNIIIDPHDPGWHTACILWREKYSQQW